MTQHVLQGCSQHGDLGTSCLYFLEENPLCIQVFVTCTCVIDQKSHLLIFICFLFFNVFIRFFFSLSDFKNFLFNRLIGFFHEIIYRHNNFYEICLVPPIVTMCFMYSCHCVYYAFLSQCVLCILITMCITCMYSCHNVYYMYVFLSKCVLCIISMCITCMYSFYHVYHVHVFLS